MSGRQTDTLTKTSEIVRSLFSSIDNALADLVDRDPGIRKNAILSLIFSLHQGLDITRALPSLEMALTDDSSEVRKSAAAALERYAFHVYGVHISLSHETAGMGPDDSASPAHYPLLPLVSKGAIVPALEHSLVKVTAPCADHESSSHPEERNPGAIHLPHTPAQCPSMIGYIPKLQVAYAQNHASSELVPWTPSCVAIGLLRRFVPSITPEQIERIVHTDLGAPPLPPTDLESDRLPERACEIPRRKSMSSFPVLASTALAVIFSTIMLTGSVPFDTSFLSAPDVSASLSLPGTEKDEQGFMSSPGETGNPLQEDRRTTPLAMPAYLTMIDRQRQRFIDAEISVFSAIEESARDDNGFIDWFNALSEEQKRGLILFVRSKALSSYLGSTEHFDEDQWLIGSSEKLDDLVAGYLEQCRLSEIILSYEDLYRRAESHRSLFLAHNAWLEKYLRENYRDFEQGLFYFFSEHQFKNHDVEKKARAFAALRKKIKRVSGAIIADRGRQTRISPKKGVSDLQIREIIAAAFFTQLFYRVPADFITLITAYETNFSMEYWQGGYGTTQQTIKAANSVLQSEFWLQKVKESSGANVARQMVPLSALDNVFLCIAEAGKTLAIKAAELDISTRDISPAKRVSFEGKRMPATWVAAYKYNGSKKNAQRYAKSIHQYYKEKRWWLKSFKDTKLASANYKN